MKRIYIICLLLTQALFAFAAGKVYWQANGVLITDRDGMVGRSPVADGRGGAIVFASDGWDSIFAIRMDREGNLPWGLHGRVVDDNAFGGVQGTTEAVSDGHGGAIAVWCRWFPWGHNLYYNRIDSLGNRVWAGNGIPLTLSDSDQVYHQAASDGMGGVVAAWQEQRNGQWDIYAQRVDSNGLRQWEDTGKVVCNAEDTQETPYVVCNKNGTSAISWVDYRNGNSQIYMDCLNKSGVTLWQMNGKPVYSTDSGQGLSGYGKVLVLPTDTTFVINWHDNRNGNVDVFAQQYNINGDKIWLNQGIVICDTINTQGASEVIGDGNGGCIYFWIDLRTGYRNVFIQRTDNDGQIMWLNNGVPICVNDSVYWNKSIVSDYYYGAIVSWQDKRSGDYDIYAQHVDSAGNMLWRVNGMPVCSLSGDQQTPLMVPSDSGTAIIIWSDGRSGYWRGYAQRVGDDPSGVAQGGIAELGVPRLKLYGNRPNPFRQKTTIKYQITEPGDVSLKVYNVAGQCVRTLANEVTNSGTHEVTWDGRGDKGEGLAQGVYFCRLGVGERVKTIKMLKVR